MLEREDVRRAGTVAPVVPPPPARDRVDVLLDHVAAIKPDSPLVTKAVTERLRRASHHIDTEIRRRLAPLGVELWEFELLTALRRSAPEYRLTMGELADDAQVTSGAITNRVTRMERQGWVRRDIVPADRRQIVVSLTDAGLARCEEVVEIYTEAQKAIFADVDPGGQQHLADALRELLLVLEGPAPEARD
jgi:DNA-binding MarR family transcriptional regulator